MHVRILLSPIGSHGWAQPPGVFRITGNIDMIAKDIPFSGRRTS
jgi:hypothetical protein